MNKLHVIKIDGQLLTLDGGIVGVDLLNTNARARVVRALQSYKLGLTGGQLNKWMLSAGAEGNQKSFARLELVEVEARKEIRDRYPDHALLIEDHYYEPVALEDLEIINNDVPLELVREAVPGKVEVEILSIPNHEEHTVEYVTSVIEPAIQAVYISRANPKEVAHEEEMLPDLKQFKDIPYDHKVIVVVGPSGSGKTTVTSDYFRSSEILTSFTTREARPGEIDGRDYYFLEKDEALKLKVDDQCLEFVQYNGNLYGYTVDEVFNKLSQGTVACVATIDGFTHLKKVLGGRVHAIYLNISKEMVEANLANRNDDEAAKAKRLELYESEAKNLNFFKKRGDSVVLDVTRDFIANRQAFEGAVAKITEPTA